MIRAPCRRPDRKSGAGPDRAGAEQEHRVLEAEVQRFKYAGRTPADTMRADGWKLDQLVEPGC